MRPSFVDGRRRAEVSVRPNIATLGPDAAPRGAHDPLFFDALVYLTCLHEIGHALSLSHTGDNRDIMFVFRRGEDDTREFFERYRDRISQRSDIRHQSAVFAEDAARLRRVYR